jgi:hypothetical protein
MSNIFINRNRD